MKINPIEIGFKGQTESERLNLRDRLRESAIACYGKGAGAERQLFERLQGEYEELTGESLSESEARS